MEEAMGKGRKFRENAAEARAGATTTRASRRWWLVAGVAVIAAAAVMVAGPGNPDSAGSLPDPGAAGQEVAVYKSPTCGCCKDWVSHLQSQGFSVVTHDVVDMGAIKAKNGVPASLTSCHTATVGGYAIEGHVPADLILRILEERPAITGLAVPGMPGGSPGMESAPKVPYDVIAWDATQATSLYAKR
jgi:hypothetical protein